MANRQRRKRQTKDDMDPKLVKVRAEELARRLHISPEKVMKMYNRKKELATLTPKKIKLHARENARAMGYTFQKWVELCEKCPQLLEVNAHTLSAHKKENAKFLGITYKDWRRLCNQEPGLAITSKDRLESSMRINAGALDVTEEQWRECCLQRGALLLYTPQVLLRKIHSFTKYLAEPETLESVYKKIPEYARSIIRRAPKRVPLIDYTTRQFVQHPILLTCSPEKLAYSYIMLTEEMKSFKINTSEEALYSYLNTSAERLALGHYYACFAKHQGREPGLYHLAGASEDEIKKALGKMPGVDTKNKKSMMETYGQNCPVIKNLRLRSGGKE